MRLERIKYKEKKKEKKLERKIPGSPHRFHKKK
jgi:hypothetical protein